MPRPLTPEHIPILAEKLLNGTISSAELEEFNSWYNQFKDEELVLSLDDRHNVQELKYLMLHRVQHKVVQEEKRTIVSMPKKWLLVAAFVGALTLVGGYFTSPVLRGDENIVHTSNNQQTKVILPDSSIVWLKPNSTIDYRGFKSDDQRRVTLSGEALFEVTKNPHKPFVIQSGEYTVRVLGTSFNMSNVINRSFQLTVLTGKVLVEKNLQDGKKEQLVIMPLQKITSSGEKQLVVRASAPEEKAQVSAGTEYIMNFENVAFKEIAERIAQKFDVKCTIQSDLLLQCRLTADLTGQSLTHTLELIAASINMDFQVKSGEVLLSGTGCE